MDRCWVALFVCACGASVPPTPTPTRAQRPLVTREQADRALRSDAPLDYERPFREKPVDRSATAQLFHARCDGGDARACIVESELTGSLDVVAANCRNGDLMSCRALPLDDGSAKFPDLPGAMSRACSTTCDAATLRQECTDGFAWACFKLGENDPSGDGDAMMAKYLKASVEGCRAGISINCGFAGLSKDDLARIDAAKRLCELHLDRCGELATAYMAEHDTKNARDAFERACQYGNTSVCLELGVKYTGGELTEPVVGRGQALIDWACRRKLPRYLADKCSAKN